MQKYTTLFSFMNWKRFYTNSYAMHGIILCHTKYTGQIKLCV